MKSKKKDWGIIILITAAFVIPLFPLTSSIEQTPMQEDYQISDYEPTVYFVGNPTPDNRTFENDGYPVLSVDANDSAGGNLTVNFYTNASGTSQLQYSWGCNAFVPYGCNGYWWTEQVQSMDKFGTKYYWSANVSNYPPNATWTNRSYWFVTKNSTAMTYNVTTTVWDSVNMTWENHVDANVGDIVTFRADIRCANTTDYNITLHTVNYDALEYYIPGSGRVTYFNGTTESKDPDWRNVGSDPSCFVNGHFSWQWNFTQEQSLTNFTRHMYVYYNMSVNNSNYSREYARLYLCGIDHEYWDSLNYTYSNDCYVGYQFNTSIDCGCNDSEASDWIVSEHVNRGDCTTPDCLDETWNEYETQWNSWRAFNTSTFGDEDWGWVYKYNNSDRLGLDSNHLSYTIANFSSANRSSSYIRARYNFEEPLNWTTSEEPFVGTIYSYFNSTTYDMVLYSFQYMALLSVIDGVLVDTVYGTNVVNQSDAHNYYDDAFWSCNATITENLDPAHLGGSNSGIWAKLVYNKIDDAWFYNAHLQAKAWGNTPWIEEPPGWMIDNYIQLSYTDLTCFGLVVWDPWHNSFSADFDFINEWRLNYSQNASHSLHNETLELNKTAPLLYFKAMNESAYWNEGNNYISAFFDYLMGGGSLGTFADKAYSCFRNLTNNISMEAKHSHSSAVVNCSYSSMYDNQNDSIYYYTFIKTNMTMMPFKNELIVHIEDTTDGSQDINDGALVAIDVDNDHVWSNNDKVLHWFWDGIQVRYNIYNGTTLWKSDIEGADPTVYATFDTAFPNTSLNWLFTYNTFLPMLHRYSYHRMYEVSIPLYYLEKGFVGSGNYLNENDTFGLNVMTIPWDPIYGSPDIGIVWENYNESIDQVLLGPGLLGTGTESLYTTWTNYMNITDGGSLFNFWFMGLWNGITNEQMQYWGHGRLGNETGYFNETYWSAELTKHCNVTNVTNIATYNLVNFSVNITNSGSQIIHGVKINDTFPSGCTFQICNLPLINVTNFYDNVWIFNITDSLAVGETFRLWITMNVSAYAAMNGTILYNFVNLTNPENANATANASFQYGTNNIPRIIWMYPVHTNATTPLLLANISVNITDSDGDTMYLNFSTNKTDTWTNSWSLIGTNTSITDGIYFSNQTFNNSPRFNTKWRWGQTKYYWRVNITDGKGWTNATYYFTTSGSRYDVNTNGIVNAIDLSFDWANCASFESYLGLYDVNNNGVVNAIDLSFIWANKT